MMTIYIVSISTLLTIIAFLLVYILYTRKLIKASLIHQDVLSKINNQSQNISFQCTADPERIFLEVSENIFRLTGYSAASILKNKTISFHQLIHPEDQSIIQKTIAFKIQENTSYQIEYRISTQKGDEKWIREQGIALYDRKGKLTAFHGILTDITNTISLNKELTAKENALQESEAQYKAITESISDYIYKVIVEKDKIRPIFINSVSENILGYSSSEFNANPDLLTNLLSPEDKQTFLDNLKIISEHNTNKTYEHKFLHKNGRTIWISNTLVFYKNRTDGSIEINGVVKDITYRKHVEHALLEAEKRYRAVFDQSGLASNVFNLSGKLIMQNAMAAKLLGGNLPDFTGKTIDEIFPAESSKILKQIIQKTYRKGTIVDEREMEMPSGKYWLKTTSHAIYDNSGKLIGIQLISQDLTEKMAMDSKILNTIIETEEKERVHFAQELHDGLGPLISAIKMYVQWLGRPNSIDRQSEILRDTEKLINQTSQAIREISFKLSPHILNNSGLIEAIKKYADQVNNTKNIQINVLNNISERFENNIETVLYRVLCECMNNTFKHANATIIIIKILKIGNKLKIIYSDNGSGFHVQNILSQKKGNGLLNMQSRLRSINGTMMHKSSPGNGSKIMITLRPELTPNINYTQPHLFL